MTMGVKDVEALVKETLANIKRLGSTPSAAETELVNKRAAEALAAVRRLEIERAIKTGEVKGLLLQARGVLEDMQKGYFSHNEASTEIGKIKTRLRPLVKKARKKPATRTR